jgi:hypothetical protein
VSSPYNPLVQCDDVPKLFTAGETVKFTRTFDLYQPGDNWTYTIYFNGPSAVFSQVGTVGPGSDGFDIVITPATLAVPAGIYRYLERVVNSTTGEVYSVGEGVVQIELDLATAPAGACLTFWEQTLAAIEAVLSGRITADIEHYQIAGRLVMKIPIKELMQIRGIAKANVWKAANPGRIGEPVYVDFTDETNAGDYPATWTDVTGLPGAGQ